MSGNFFWDDRTTDGVLIEQLRNGDSIGWRTLMQAYSPMVTMRCAKKDNDIDDHQADDVEQDVYLAVLKYFPKFEWTPNTASFRRWLSTIISSKIADVQRSNPRQMRARGGTDPQIQVSDVYDPFPRVVEGDSTSKPVSGLRNDHLQKAFRLMDERFRPKTAEMAKRIVMYDEPVEEVAKKFKVDANTVRKARLRVLNLLKAEFGAISD